MRRGPEIGETITFLFIAAICGGIFYGVWLTLQRGAGIAGLGGSEKVVQMANSAASNHPEPPPARQEGAVRQIPPANPTHSAHPPRSAVSSGATMYKWVDENGTTHFSDQPRAAGAERLEVASVTTMNFPQTHSPPPSPVSRTAAVSPQPSVASLPSGRPAGTDYRFSVLNGFQKSRTEVILSGRVEGPACKSLQISMSAESQFGKRVHASTVVNDIDFGSKLFQVSKWAIYPEQTAPRWNVTDAQAYCAEY